MSAGESVRGLTTFCSLHRMPCFLQMRDQGLDQGGKQVQRGGDFSPSLSFCNSFPMLRAATPFQQLVAALDNANIYGEDDDVDPLSQRALAFVLEDEARMQQFVKERFKLRGSGKTLSDTTVKNLSCKALQHFETSACWH